LAQGHEEMKRPSVTLVLLWQESTAGKQTDGYGFTRASAILGANGASYPSRAKMRQNAPCQGSGCSGYYAETRFRFVDQRNGAERHAHIFVAASRGPPISSTRGTRVRGVGDWIQCESTRLPKRRIAKAGGVRQLRPGSPSPFAMTAGIIALTGFGGAEQLRLAVLPARGAQARDKARWKSPSSSSSGFVPARTRNRRCFRWRNSTVPSECVRPTSKPKICAR